MQQNKTIYSVSELNATVSKTLFSQFPVLWLEGEISNFTKAGSGHIYCQLKDDKAQIRAAMFSGKNRLLHFTPKNGMQIQARGRLSLYEPRGDYQFIIEHMEEAGHGELQRQFELLKEKLQAEGLFAEALKKPLPEIPKSIGIITSKTGAALQDVIRVMAKRLPSCPLIIYPSLVQGEQAAKQLVQALACANQRKEVDVLLLVRGGGSIEDLHAFNDENLARQIAASEIPIISGVGHEIDFTIADFVADLRAPTPSAAAESAAMSAQQLLAQMTAQQQNLVNLQQRLVLNLQYQFELLHTRLLKQSPAQQFLVRQQRLGDLKKRLLNTLATRLEQNKHRTDLATQSLYFQNPKTHLQRKQQNYALLLQRLSQAAAASVKNKQNQFKNLINIINTVSPLATLQRGYAIAQNAEGNAITHSKDVKIHDQLTIKLAEGSLHVDVTSKD